MLPTAPRDLKHKFNHTDSAQQIGQFQENEMIRKKVAEAKAIRAK